jgi:putative ABC transport system permease protein
MVVVGIMGADFQPPEPLAGQRVDVWLPLDTRNGEDRDSMGFHVMSVAGRLADGASVTVAQEQLDAFTAERVAEYPDYYLRRDGTVRNVPLVPLLEGTVGSVSATLYVLLGAVGLMLLIACANVANLFLARGTERGREIALRGALGASRSRIIGQLLTESVMIAVVGGSGGMAIAFAGVGLFARTNPGNIPRLYDVAVDPRVLAFAFVTSLLTGALFGILPAMHASRTDVSETLKEGAGSVTTGRRGRRTRGALVVAEIALALVLLVGAGLLFRSLLEMVRVDPGFRTEQLVDLTLQLGATYTDEQRVAFAGQIVERLEALPGTEAAAVGWTLPFVYHGGSSCCWRTSISDAAQPAPESPPLTMVHPVTSGYFGMLGAHLLSGRDFVRADNGAQPPAAVINDEAAREVFGSADVVGRALRFGDNEVTIVGVVAGMQHYGLSRPIGNAVYVPYERFGGELPMMHVGVRSRADLETVVAGMREAVWAIEPDLPIQDIVTMQQRVADSLATPRFLSLLLGVFAGVALLLACGGIYGSMLYSVSQRRREMGIRLALGAGGGNVIRMILGHGLLLTAFGLAIGVAGALALSSFVESLVWGIRPTDPLTFGAVTLVLAAAAMAACFFPAYKASRADPLQTLRAE